MSRTNRPMAYPGVGGPLLPKSPYGLTGDTRPLEAADPGAPRKTAQLIDAAWPEPQVLLITGSATGNCDWKLETGLERGQVTADTTPLVAAYSRVVFARSVRLSITNRAPNNGANLVSAVCIPINATLDVSAIAPFAPTPAGVPTIATRTQAAQSVAGAVFVGANVNRRGLTVQNRATAGNLFLGLGTTGVSLVDYTVELVPGAYYEMPYRFAGEVQGIWDAAGAGDAQITEL